MSPYPLLILQHISLSTVKYFLKLLQPWFMDDADIPKVFSTKVFVSIFKTKSKDDQSTNGYNDKGNPGSLMWCVSCLWERNEWDAMNAEPEEQMRGSGQVIRVVNYPGSVGEGHSAGLKAAVNLSVDACMHDRPASPHWAHFIFPPYTMSKLCY